jgi:simple sugar transport system permease protein
MAAPDNTTRGYVVGLGVITAGIFAAMSLARPDFLTFDNLNSMAFQFPEFGTLALAVLLSMISGGIDLSVVSTANLASIVAAMIMHAEAGSAWAAIPCALAVGAACGGLNGLLVAVLGLPPILATLGTMQVFSGIGIVMTKGSSVTGLPDWFTDFGITSFFEWIPLPTAVFAAVALSTGLLLTFSELGLRARLLGTNPVAPRFAGMPVRSVIVKIYALSGVISSLAGLIVLARVNSANADYGSSYLLLVILINVLAGVSVTGGFGSTTGVVLSVILLQLISSGLNFLSVSNFARDLLFGALLVLVMAGRAAAGFRPIRIPVLLKVRKTWKT